MKRQKGLGLVEMMVAMAIGILLLLGLGTLFVAMRNTSLLTQKMSAEQNQQRLGLYFLRVAVTGAGYFPVTPTVASSPFTGVAALAAAGVLPAVPAFTAGQAIAGKGSSSSLAPDSISVRFAASANGTEQGCSASLNPGDIYIDTFNVSGGFLSCFEQDTTAGTSTSTNLVSGVNSMNIAYGVATTSTPSVTQYLTGTQVTALSGGWNMVKTVKVTLIFNNPLYGQPTQPATISLTEIIPYLGSL